MVEILHSIQGRARFKVKGLYRSESFKKHLESGLSKNEGISSFSTSLLTGNVLVYFNSNNTPHTIASFINDVVTNFKYTEDNTKKFFSNEHKSKVNRSVRSRRKLRRLIVKSEDQETNPWHLMGSRDVLDKFGVDPNLGLPNTSAKELLKKYGPNVLPESVPRSGFSLFISQFKSLPVALLSAAAAISMFTSGFADAVVIISVVMINAFIGYTTESQTEKIIHSLRSLVRPTALVLRDGILNEIGAEDVVPGDILVLRPGSYVAADARLIESNHLSIDESALTGESIPSIKTPNIPNFNQHREAKHMFKPSFGEIGSNGDGYEIPLADRTNMVYMGTLVIGGQGIAVVVATGRFTEIGKIQTLVGEAMTPETPIEKQLNRIGTQLVFISGAVCGVVFIIGMLRGYSFLQMIKTSISLAVAAVPEGLPTVATTTLALGIRNMKRHNVLIRRLDAVETLGSIQTICLDKTGTITQNKMTVVSLYVGMRLIKVSDGKFILDSNYDASMDKKLHPLKRDNYLNLYYCDELLRLIHISVLCNESVITKTNGKYLVNGSPTENALIHMALSSGIDIEMLRQKFQILKIIHRSENRNFMLTIHDFKLQSHNSSKQKIVAVKGSPNEVLSLCSFYMKDGQKKILTEDDRFSIEIENERMAGNALRVLAVAYAFVSEETESSALETEGLISNGKDNFTEFNSISYLPPNDLIWLGLVGMADPIRDGVKDLIGLFHQAGIDTIMITGDQSATAYAIGKELNLSKGEQLEILESTHLANIEPDILKALCERVHVFSRVSPAHKLQIVQSLQNAGKIVAMTGDGINDGPALKAANIGIAMGHAGTDVAREVAGVVLEDDKLETMIIAISHGRTIYNNIRKSVRYLLATNMSEIMIMFAGIALGIGQPLNAMQLLWINLISDIAPGIALSLEAPEPDVLTQPPRNPDEPIIKSSDFKRITYESAVLTTGALCAYGYGIARYGIGQQAGTMAFTSLAIGQILHAISCRSEQYSIFQKGQLPPNRYLNISVAGSLILQLIAMTVPGLRSLLGTTPVGPIDGLIIGASAVAPLLINESTK